MSDILTNRMTNDIHGIIQANINIHSSQDDLSQEDVIRSCLVALCANVETVFDTLPDLKTDLKREDLIMATIEGFKGLLTENSDDQIPEA